MLKIKQDLIRYTLSIIFLLAGCYSSSAQGTLVNFNTIPKSGTALVLAHMDDDVIWMLPWWQKTEKFICGAMPPTPVYQTVVDQQQEYMDAHGYNIEYKDNWLTPWGMITQMQYSDYYWDDSPSAQYLAADHLIAYWDNGDLQLVRREIDKIKAKLEQYIANPSVSRIITHNNWGEYGHQHHKAINKAVRELAVKYRKDVWMLGCDNGDFEDIDVPNGITYTMGSFNDPTLFTSIRTIYQNNWCWTWPDVIPSGDHKFIKIVDAGVDKSNILTGESVTISGPVQSEAGAYIFDGVDDYMTLPGYSTSSFTIAMKIRPAVIASMDISKMTEYPENPTSDRNFYLNSDGRVSARIFDGSSRVVTSTTALTSGNWTDIVMTGDGSNLRIYVNGILENTVPAGSAITSYETPEFVMGQTAMTSSFFNGQINDVKLFDRTLTDSEVAALSGVVYTINANAGTGGVITPAGAVTAIVGSNSTFNITPDAPYLISDVKVDNVSIGAVSTYTFTNVHASHTISASFSPKVPHTINVAASGFGTISPSGAVIVAEGTDPVFTITPNAGYQVSDVLVDNVSVGALTSYTFVNVLTDHTISAVYTTASTWSITASGSAGGSISPSGTVLVNHGSNQTFSITPNSGYRISGVLVDSNPVGNVSSYSFTNIVSNHTISVSFSLIPTYTINATAGSGGTISPSGSISVTEGAGRSFTITPNIGYYIANVLVDNGSVGAVPNYSFNNVTSNHTISASFARLTYNISSTADAGGTINPLGTVSVNYGNDLTFDIIPDTGYNISGVLVDNVDIGVVSEYTFSNVTSGHTISANFSLINFTITSSAGPGGSITPQGTVTSGYGTNSTFSITPNAGYYISDVRVDNISVGALSSYTFSNVTGNHTISAVFTLYNYTINASAGTGGTISPSGNLTLDYGESQSYSITPNAGYHVTDVKVDNVSMGAISSYSFNSITSAHTISASFALITYTLTGTAGTGGIVSPAGTSTVTYGSSKTYTITPSTGYRIVDVRVDNISVGPLSSYTFSNIVSNHTISASFTLLQYTITSVSNSGGSITPAGLTTLTHGSSQTYSITPSTGFEIKDIKVDGVSVGKVPVYNFTNITGSHTIAATFALISYTVTPNAGDGGSISPDNEVDVDYGSGTSFTITPDIGYYISDVLVDNVSVGPVDSYNFTDITTDHTITALFTIRSFAISASAGDNGTVTPAGSALVNYGTGMAYSITPEQGYKISDVKVDNVSVGAVSSYSFDNVVSDHTISASFENIKIYTISASAGIGGKIDPPGKISIQEESNQTYRIEPDNGYRILKVTVDNQSLGEVSEYTFSSVYSDHSIDAEFTSLTAVNAYPSPFSDEFRVKIETPLEGKFDLYVFDMASRIVYVKKGVDGNMETDVNLQSSPGGVYIVRLYYHNAVVNTIKVVKY